MRSFTTAATAILAYAVAAYATEYIVKDYCQEDVFLYVADPTGTSAPIKLPSGQAYIHQITGLGNSLGVVKQASDYWSATGAKLILGTSRNATEDILYWTLSHVNGDPMNHETFGVGSSRNGQEENVCENATSYDGNDGVVHACPDVGNDITLTLNLC